MPATLYFLVLAQALGACVGTLYVIWGEFAYIKAMRDGNVDEAEEAHLVQIARGLRRGMALPLVASIGLIIYSYLRHSPTQPALTPNYWTFIILALLVIGISWALSRKHVSFELGSATVFTGWWYLTFLTFGLLPALSFGASVAFFIVATGLFYALLHHLRYLAVRTHQIPEVVSE